MPQHSDTPPQTLARGGVKVRDFPEAVGGMYDEMAGACAGYVLRCKGCGDVQRPTRADLSRYFRDGWPVCCGETPMFERESLSNRVDRSAGPGPKPGEPA